MLQQTGPLLAGAIAVTAAPAQPSLAGQVGHLLVESVPTALLFLVLVVVYEFLVNKPLSATLGRRRALTEGAMEEAKKAIANAEARASEYAEKLRLARAEAYKIREARVNQWNVEREAALETARKNASLKVREAEAQLEAEAAAARQTIQTSAAELARQAIRAVLPVAVGGSR